MHWEKSIGSVVFSIDLFWGSDNFLFEAVGVLFDRLVYWQYPSHLNYMYILPLYKGQGSQKSTV